VYKWCLTAQRFVRLRAGADRVGGNAFQEDRDDGDDEAEAEQPPVRRNPATAARCPGAHRYLFCLPGALELWPRDTVVVVFVCPGAVELRPLVVVVFVCPGAVELRPGDAAAVVVVFVCPGAVALRPGEALIVVVFVCPGAVALWPR
jgi:hypothetical protein